MYDLNQRTMQALNNLTIVHATFEQAGANLEVEISEGDLLFADVRAAMEGLAEAQQHEERLQGELKSSRESLDMDMQESMSTVDDSREIHGVVCPDLQTANTRHSDRCTFGTQRTPNS